VDLNMFKAANTL